MTKRFFLLTLAVLCGSALLAQNKALDHDVYDGWQSVTAVQLSPDGRLLSYEIRPQEGDGTLYVKDLEGGAEISVPRGTGLRWAQDVSLGYFTVKAPFADTRQAKIDKKKADEQPKDSLARIDLGALTWETVGASGTAKIGYEAAPYLFAAVPAKDRKTKDLLLIKASTGLTDTLKYVSDFAVSPAGDRLAVINAKEEKDSLSFSAVVLYELPKERVDTLSTGREEYAGLAFNAAGDKLVFTATDDKEKEDGTPRHAVLLAQETVLQKATRRAPAVTEWRTCELLSADAAGLPEGWVVGKDSGPAFSNKSTRLVLRLQEYFPPKDTTVYDFEAAQLDIWVWDKHTVPPMDKVARSRSQRSAVINLDRPGQLLVLSQNAADRITFFRGAEGDYALSMDTDPYYVDNYWAADRPVAGEPAGRQPPAAAQGRRRLCQPFAVRQIHRLVRPERRQLVQLEPRHGRNREPDRRHRRGVLGRGGRPSDPGLHARRQPFLDR